MNNKNLRTLLVIAVVLIGLFTGVLFAAKLAITPSLGLLDGSNYTLVKQAQIRVLQVWMSIICFAYLVLGIYILVLAKKQQLHGVYKSTLIAVVLVGLALAYSAFTDIPYNQEILRWTVANPPVDWAVTRHAWDVANFVRLFPSLAAFIAQTYALFSLTDTPALAKKN